MTDIRRAPTMKDVARIARCDTSTVSLALRNDPRISVATAARVRAAAEGLKYRVNPLVAAWVTARRAARPVPSQVAMAYLTSHPSGTQWGESQHFRSIFEGAKERAAEFGYALTQFQLADFSLRQEALNHVLVTRAVRGLIIGPTLQHYTLTGIEWERFALVTVGYALTKPVVHRGDGGSSFRDETRLRSLPGRGATADRAGDYRPTPRAEARAVDWRFFWRSNS
jgi:LacI family transcriptional regulator